MTNFTPFLRRLSTRTLSGCVLMGTCSAAWSADSASVLALKALLGPQAAFQQSGSLPPTPAHSSGAASSSLAAPALLAQSGVADQNNPTVTVQRGETLDRLIRRALPDVPLHPDFLRKAFVSLNPQVFPQGSLNSMKAGAKLQVPSLAALRQMALSQHPSSAALFLSADMQSEQLSQSRPYNPADPSDPRRWVRFP